ncbi:MAG TPA: hypothetical protein PLQ93_06925 [Bacteroidia bacterium]|nr:hypothetical protein [Bacteroidia bacterium]
MKVKVIHVIKLCLLFLTFHPLKAQKPPQEFKASRLQDIDSVCDLYRELPPDASIVEYGLVLRVKRKLTSLKKYRISEGTSLEFTAESKALLARIKRNKKNYLDLLFKHEGKIYSRIVVFKIIK